ncbi:AI-2E family transporter [Kordiimonas pumila]|uniref:AI-2E family transporter n=1 Tax=Kordiimonas pumila TaxID=2161677 RepID=A0ABV7D2N1_9PROT|nr:AI-2E family transporter [Kordiimonas pumila]
MTIKRWGWIVAAIFAILFLYLIKGILLPFLVGFAVAYFLDPVADRLEAKKLPRSIAAGLVIAGFFILITGIVLAFWPIVQSQLGSVSETLPKTISGLRPWLSKAMQGLSDSYNIGNGEDINSILGSFSEQILGKVQDSATNILKGGLALFNILTLVLISPVVAFYMLRDWDLLVAKVNGWLPPEQAPAIRQVSADIDTVLAGFVRGQLMVSTIMGVMYALGWMLVGLDFAIILGLLAGIMSFIPFVGTLVALAVALALGVGQWGLDPIQLGLVAAVFFVVQLIEGSFLTPRLIGERVGLHPVWVLFAVLAGGELMGFVGVLIALPVSAALAVLVRYWIKQYREHYKIADPTEDQGSIKTTSKL